MTFVPERRAEVDDREGDSAIIGQRDRVAEAISRCRDAGLEVSLFIDPDRPRSSFLRKSAAQAVELPTGRYADATSGSRGGRGSPAVRSGGSRSTSSTTCAVGGSLISGTSVRWRRCGA